MKSIRIYTLFSSSSGNCHYIQLGDREILVDAGKNAKKIGEALTSIGTDIGNISSLFITHEHADHTSAIRVLQKKNNAIRLHLHPMCGQSISDSGVNMAEAVFISGGECINDGCICVHAFPVPHDSHACLGYRIEYTEDGEHFTIGIATDIGHLTREISEGLLGCDCVIVESNHDADMLAHGPYPDHLKARIFSSEGHLQNESCAKLCGYLSRCGTHHIMLAHISKENNDPALALKLTCEAVSEGGASVVYATPDTPVCLYDSTQRTDAIC